MSRTDMVLLFLRLLRLFAAKIRPAGWRDSPALPETADLSRHRLGDGGLLASRPARTMVFRLVAEFSPAPKPPLFAPLISRLPEKARHRSIARSGAQLIALGLALPPACAFAAAPPKQDVVDPNAP